MTPTPTICPEGHLLNEYRIERVLGGGASASPTWPTIPTWIAGWRSGIPALDAATGRLWRPSPLDDARRAFDWGLQRFCSNPGAGELSPFGHRPGAALLPANDTAYMVMEYETGQPCSTGWGGCRSTGRARCASSRPLLDGLEAVHGAGSHRDIKPGNIYIRDDGSPVLLDFSSARRVEADNGISALTAVVSPGLCAGRAVSSPRQAGPRTDLTPWPGDVLDGHRAHRRWSPSRMREDTMPAAARIGNVAVFGIGLLNAIDWALKPDENAACGMWPRFAGPVLAPPAGGEAPAEPQPEAPLSSGFPAPRRAPSLPRCCSPMSPGVWRRRPAHRRPHPAGPDAHPGGRAPAAHQPAGLEHQGRLRRLLRGRSGGRPARRHPDRRCGGGRRPGVQMGINLGPVRVASDAGGRSRILGDGIATACRVMRLAEPGRVLVSRAYFEVIHHLLSVTRRRASSTWACGGCRAREHDLCLRRRGAWRAVCPDPSIPRPMAGADLTRR